jgi:hypothetical protein
VDDRYSSERWSQNRAAISWHLVIMDDITERSSSSFDRQNFSIISRIMSAQSKFRSSPAA